MSRHADKPPSRGPYKPTLILHGGAGAITRKNLPPELYEQYHSSLLEYLTSTRALLDSGASALEAACGAVCRFEDDPLFNCGRGAVFTKAGTIEMEASVMVTSVDESGPPEGSIKRGAAVSLIRNTRHPILLAKEVLVAADDDGGMGGTSTMHCHLSGKDVEEWGWKDRGLERKGDDWFWTQKRWDEHRRGLWTAHSTQRETWQGREESDGDDHDLPSQGTVGAVCMDSWGNLCVATSTGGLTNKAVGRIGDTPSVGAGFWAESWHEDDDEIDSLQSSWSNDLYKWVMNSMGTAFGNCLPLAPQRRQGYLSLAGEERNSKIVVATPTQTCTSLTNLESVQNGHRYLRRAVAMSGTGNGDSFLRTNAARSTAAICRFSFSRVPLSNAVTAISGPDGELQQSAGERWLKTGEGQGGTIGIEVCTRRGSGGLSEFQNYTAEVVFDFNCGGLWRAWYFVDSDGEERPKVMVFKNEYKE